MQVYFKTRGVVYGAREARVWAPLLVTGWCAFGYIGETPMG